jgi:UDP-glucose 4-epimerase
LLKKEIQDTDYLFNFVGVLPFSINTTFSPSQSIEINVKAMVDLIENCVRNNHTKVIYPSGIVVYGNPQYLPVDENHPTNPTDFYGASKLSVENYLKILSAEQGFPLTILRIASVYGPGFEANCAIPNFIKSILKDESPLIYGTGAQKRDYIFVGDVIDACMLSLKKEVTGTLNIGSGQSVTIKEIAEHLIKISGKDLNIKYITKEHGIDELYLDITKAKKLGFSPKTELEEGLRKMYKWYKEKWQM